MDRDRGGRLLRQIHEEALSTTWQEFCDRLDRSGGEWFVGEVTEVKNEAYRRAFESIAVALAIEHAAERDAPPPPTTDWRAEIPNKTSPSG